MRFSSVRQSNLRTHQFRATLKNLNYSNKIHLLVFVGSGYLSQLGINLHKKSTLNAFLSLRISIFGLFPEESNTT